MDNTQGLGAAMEASYQRDQARSQEQRIQALERKVTRLIDVLEILVKKLGSP